MSDAKKCDRCGVYYDKLDPGGVRPAWSGNFIYKVTIEGNSDNALKKYDLCSECAADIMDSLQNYIEPFPKPDPIEEKIEENESLGQKHLKEVCPRCIHFNDHGTYGQSVCRVCLGGVSMYKYNIKKFEEDEK